MTLRLKRMVVLGACCIFSIVVFSARQQLDANGSEKKPTAAERLAAQTARAKALTVRPASRSKFSFEHQRARMVAMKEEDQLCTLGSMKEHLKDVIVKERVGLLIAARRSSQSAFSASSALHRDLIRLHAYQVRRGVAVARNLRIAFAGLVHRREAGRFRSLDLELDQMARLGRRFRDYR